MKPGLKMCHFDVDRLGTLPTGQPGWHICAQIKLLRCRIAANPCVQQSGVCIRQSLLEVPKLLKSARARCSFFRLGYEHGC